MKQRLAYALVMLVIWLIIAPPASADSEQLPLFTFGLLADIQYADVPIAGSRDYRSSLKKLDDCIGDFNSGKLAFVAQLGDIVDRDPTSYDEVITHFNKFKTRRYHVVGNHDVSCGPVDMMKKLGIRKRYYDFSKGSWRFIVLDGNDVGFLGNTGDVTKTAQAEAMLQNVRDKKGNNAQTWNGGIGDVQLSWLKTRLQHASRAQQSVVILCHYPIYPSGGVCNLWNDDVLLQTIEPYECVKVWFNGHEHSGNYGIKTGIHFVTLQGMVETTDTTAYAIVEVYPDRLNVIGTGRAASRNLIIR
jgi:3',5'-cyclic AMP phosphodiesterase CpdA